MNPALPEAFLRPGLIAHRGLHGPGRPENTLAAFDAACDAGYGIELDVQPSADGVAMAFHDATLDRLTDATGPVDALTAEALGRTIVRGGDGTVPTLRAALERIAGRVPVLIEVKDRDGDMGPNVGALEAAVAQAVDGYAGPLATMSFNPHSVAALARLMPHRPRGLTTSAFEAGDWPALSEATRMRLAAIPDLDRIGAAFVSHQADALGMDRVRAIRAAGLPVLCWTIRSSGQARQARRYADAVTFEGYLP